jgi:uncharacterized protein YggE
MSKNTIRGSVAAGLVAAFVAAYFLGGVRSPQQVAAAPAQSSPTQSPAVGEPAVANTVSVAGLGRVTGTPDTLELQIGVESHGADVSKALAAGNAALAKVRDALKAHGVVAADLKTSGLDVRANYRYDNNGGQPTLIDYIAAESLTAKLRDLDKAGAAITAAVAAGGNDARLNGIALTLEGNTSLIEQARAAAFADAKAKAEQYARLAGRELGVVISVTERAQDSPQPVPQAFAAAALSADSAKSVPIERGSQDVAVNVDVVWSIK